MTHPTRTPPVEAAPEASLWHDLRLIAGFLDNHGLTNAAATVLAAADALSRLEAEREEFSARIGKTLEDWRAAWDRQRAEVVRMEAENAVLREALETWKRAAVALAPTPAPGGRDE